MLALMFWAGSYGAGSHAAAGTDSVAGMPPVLDPANLYSETRSDKLSRAVANVPSRVYVPNVKSNEVHVIDPATFKVIDRFKVGRNPQHVVSWDLTTLWVTNNAEGRTEGAPMRYGSVLPVSIQRTPRRERKDVERLSEGR